MKASLGIILISGAVCAQNVISLTKEKTADGGSKVVVNIGGPPRPGCLAAVIRNAPYAAIQTTEKIRTLADGTRVIEATPISGIYRDSEGRRRFNTFFATGAGEEPIEFDVIRDYVAGREYLLDIANHVVHRMVFDPRATRGNCPEVVPENRFAPAAIAPVSVRRSLGSKTIEADLSDGTLLTTTIPAGAEGNDKPIVVTAETWTSRQLNMRILSTRRDPREGTTVTRLTDIFHREPVPELFKLPADYAVVDEATSFSIEIRRPAVPENERAVRAVIQKFADARNAHDGKAAAATYTSDGEYLSSPQARGQDELAALWGRMRGYVRRTVTGVEFTAPRTATARVKAQFFDAPNLAAVAEVFVVVSDGHEWKIRSHRQSVP